MTKRQTKGYAYIPPAPSPEQVTKLAVHITHWKRAFLARYFPGRHFHFLPKGLSEPELSKFGTRTSSRARCKFLVFGPELPPAFGTIAKERNLPVTLLEDGFLRSHRPSTSGTPRLVADPLGRFSPAPISSILATSIPKPEKRHHSKRPSPPPAGSWTSPTPFAPPAPPDGLGALWRHRLAPSRDGAACAGPPAREQRPGRRGFPD